MRQIDDAHHREHEGQAASDQRVVARQQHALDKLVDHGRAPPGVVNLAQPEIACVISSRETSALPRSTTRPSSMQSTRSATSLARQVLLDQEDRRA
jgi:hypothetical protein